MKINILKLFFAALAAFIQQEASAQLIPVPLSQRIEAATTIIKGKVNSVRPYSHTTP